MTDKIVNVKTGEEQTLEEYKSERERLEAREQSLRDGQGKQPFCVNIERRIEHGNQVFISISPSSFILTEKQFRDLLHRMMDFELRRIPKTNGMYPVEFSNRRR